MATRGGRTYCPKDPSDSDSNASEFVENFGGSSGGDMENAEGNGGSDARAVASSHRRRSDSNSGPQMTSPRSDRDKREDTLTRSHRKRSGSEEEEEEEEKKEEEEEEEVEVLEEEEEEDERDENTCSLSSSESSYGHDLADNDIEYNPEDGWQLQDFTVGPYLASGRFGDVYLAEEKISTMIVALKVLNKRNPEFDDKYFKNELLIQSHLFHRNILRMHTCFYDDDRAYMVLEAACGEVMDLLKHTQRSGKEHPDGLHENEVAVIHRQTINAMTYLHNKHICHRDLKPENLLYTTRLDCECKKCQGRAPAHRHPLVKLADFGWSCHLPPEENVRRWTFCGTTEYISPDMAKGGGEYSPYANDIWALGILVYELAYGTTPYSYYLEDSRTNQAGIYKAIANTGPISYPHKFPEDMRDYLDLFLQPEEKHRVRLRDADKVIHGSKWLKRWTEGHPYFTPKK